jgi:hypothetical protein
MSDWPPVLFVLTLVAYLVVVYMISRVLVGFATANPGALVRATSPIVGAAAIAIQLWIYGAVHLPWNVVAIFLPWLACAVVVRRRLRQAIIDDWRDTLAEVGHLAGAGALELVLAGAIVVVGLVYLLNLATQSVLGWDAIAMWLYKANLFYGQQAVDLGPISTDVRRNLDYPPLYPLIVDSMYALIGRSDEILGKSVTYVFFFSGVLGFLVTARQLVGRQLSMTFTFLVAASPIFLNAVFAFPYMGWADYPVAILMLVSLLHLVAGLNTGARPSYALAIVFAGLAALTKNEGESFLLLVVLVLAIPFIVALARRRAPFAPDRTSVALVVLGLAPFIAWLLYLKFNGIESARVVGQTGLRELLPSLPGRIGDVLVQIRKLFSFKLDYPWLVASYLVSAVLIAFARTRTGLVVLIVLSGQIAGYFAVYLIAPFDAQYIVSTTFDRLMLQLTPSLVLLLAVALAPYVTPAAIAREAPSAATRAQPVDA